MGAVVLLGYIFSDFTEFQAVFWVFVAEVEEYGEEHDQEHDRFPS
jgi:hypothetical protein